VLLVIDTGNTHTVVGLYDPETTPADGRRPESGLIDHWRLATNAERTEDEYALLVQEFLGFHGMALQGDVGGVVVSSGVPAVTVALRSMTRRYLGFDAVVLGPGVKSGMSVLYDNPHEVGADRIANAVGAFDLYGGPAIVVDLGTATTFDVITADAGYLGGAITPGVEISMEALFRRAALLRRVELVEPRSVIGRNTMESIQSGVVYGYASLIDGMIERIEAELGGATTIATGGLAHLIAPHTSVQFHEPWLTLHGLRIVYEKNTGA
jgi:type III pantothenate kinase